MKSMKSMEKDSQSEMLWQPEEGDFQPSGVGRRFTILAISETANIHPDIINEVKLELDSMIDEIY